MKVVAALVLLHAGAAMAADADLREHDYSSVANWTAYSIHLDRHPVCIVSGTDPRAHAGFGFSSSDFRPGLSLTVSLWGDPVSAGGRYGIGIWVGIRQNATAIAVSSSPPRMEAREFFPEIRGYPPAPFGTTFLNRVRTLESGATVDLQKGLSLFVSIPGRDVTQQVRVKPGDAGMIAALDGFDRCLSGNRIPLPP